jgi:hypothetical protein
MASNHFYHDRLATQAGVSESKGKKDVREGCFSGSALTLIAEVVPFKGQFEAEHLTRRLVMRQTLRLSSLSGVWASRVSSQSHFKREYVV